MANHATRCDTTRWNRPRLRVARGFVAITTATILVFALGAIIAPSSISHSAIIGMVPFAAVLAIAGRTPRSTTRLLASIAGNTTWGIPNAALFAVAALVIVSVLTGKTVAGRRFEAIGANPAAARAVGLRVRLHRTLAFVWAQLLYCLAGALLAGITHQPTAFQGDSLLLPSVAVVVLAGTSLLGGR